MADGEKRYFKIQQTKRENICIFISHFPIFFIFISQLHFTPPPNLSRDIQKPLSDKGGEKGIILIERVILGMRKGVKQFPEPDLIKENIRLEISPKGILKGKIDYKVLQPVEIAHAPLAAHFYFYFKESIGSSWFALQADGKKVGKIDKTPPHAGNYFRGRGLSLLQIDTPFGKQRIEVEGDKEVSFYDVRAEDPAVSFALLRCSLFKPGSFLRKGQSFSFEYVIQLPLNDREIISLKKEFFPLWAEVLPPDVRFGKFYLIENTPTQLEFRCNGIRERIREPKLIIETDVRVNLIGAFFLGRYGYIDKYQKQIFFRKEQIIRNGRKYVRYRLPLSWEYFPANLHPKNPFTRGTTITAFFEPTTRIKEPTSLFWHFEVDSRKGEEKEIKIPPTLPPLKKTDNPKSFIGGVYGNNEALSIRNEELRNKILQVYNQIGIKWASNRIREENRKILEMWGWKFFGVVTQMSGFQFITSKDVTGKDDIDLRTVLSDGSRSKYPYQICYQYAIEHSNPGDDFFEAYKRNITPATKNSFGVSYDFEPWCADRGMLKSCFCPRCLRAFSSFANIPLSILTPKEILSRYKKEWVKFRCYQNAEIWRIFVKILKSINPQCQAILTSSKVYPPTIKERILEWEGVDLGLAQYDKYADIHMPMIYTGGVTFYQDVERFKRSLSKPLVPLMCTGDGVVSPLTAQEIKMNILAAATSGCSGIVFFPGCRGLDGLCLKKINDAFSKIASLEKFFFKGKRKDNFISVRGIPEVIKSIKGYTGKKISVELPDWSKVLLFKVHQYRGDYLVSIFNYHPDKKAIAKISFPHLKKERGSWYLYEPLSKKFVGKKHYQVEELKKGILYQIPPQTVKFLILSKKAPKEVKGIIPFSASFFIPQEVKIAQLKKKMVYQLIGSYWKMILSG